MGRLGLCFQDREDGNGVGVGVPYSTRNSVSFNKPENGNEKKERGGGIVHIFQVV